MTILMTGLCEKGADQIWKQCNDAMYRGSYLAGRGGICGRWEAWFFRTLLQLGTGLSGSLRKKRMNVTCRSFGGKCGQC